MVDTDITEIVEYEVMKQDQNTGCWQFLEGFPRKSKLVEGTFLWIFPCQRYVDAETSDEQITRAVDFARKQYGIIGIFKKITTDRPYYVGPAGRCLNLDLSCGPIWKDGTWL